MTYEQLNLQNGDVLTDDHILHIEQGIQAIESDAENLKSKMISILNDKGIQVAGDSEISNILKEVSRLKTPEHVDYAPGEFIDITEGIASGQIKLLVKDGQFSFKLKASGNYMVDWGDGRSEIGLGEQTNTHTHQYAAGTGKPCSLGYTQFVVTITPTDGNIFQFLVNGGTSHTQNLLWFAAKDVYFDYVMQMFSNSTSLKYVDAIGGSFGISDTSFSGAEMCNGCTSLERFNVNFCATKCISLANAFKNCTNLKTVTGEWWDLVICTSLYYTFNNCTNLETIPGLNISACISCSYAFTNCSKLTFKQDYLDFSSCTMCENMFNGCTSITSLCLKNMDNVTNARSMFWNCTSLSRLNQETFSMNSALTIDGVFGGCSSLYELPVLNLPVATSVYDFCKSCTKLSVVPEIISLPKATAINGFFTNCSSLIKAPRIEAPLATNLTGLFNWCSKMVSSPDQSFPLAKDIHWMYKGCSALESLPGISAPVADIIYELFSECSSATTCAEAYNFSSAGANSYQIFLNCLRLKTPPKKLLLPSATNVYNAFSGCRALESPPEVMDFSSAIRIDGLFKSCSALKTPAVINAPVATTANNIYEGCSSLKEGGELNLPKALNVSAMYSGWSSLLSTVEYYFPVANNIVSFYSNCSSVVVIKKIRSDTGVNANNAFVGCSLLKELYFPEVERITSANSMCVNTTNIAIIYGDIPYTNDYLPVAFSTQRNLQGTITISKASVAVTITGCKNLDVVVLKDVAESVGNISLDNNNLSADVINNIFTALPNAKYKQSISVKGNPGAATCNTTIATIKGWKVTAT